MMFYGILDIMAQPAFVFYHAHTLNSVPFDSYRITGLHRGVSDAHDEKLGLTGAGTGTVHMSGQNTDITNGAEAPPATYIKGDISETV